MARYDAQQALGMIETVGMVPAIEGCDKMLKAADVELISYENVDGKVHLIFLKMHKQFRHYLVNQQKIRRKA